MNKHKQAIAAAIMEKLRPGDIVHIPRPRGAGRVKDSCTQQWPDRLPFGCYCECLRPEQIVPEKDGAR